MAQSPYCAIDPAAGSAFSIAIASLGRSSATCGGRCAASGAIKRLRPTRSGFSVNTSWAARNKERIEKFLAAYTKAVAWFNDGSNRSEAIRVLVEASRQSPEDTEKSYDMYRKIDFFEPKGEVSRKQVAEVIDILRSDMRDKPLDINRLFLPNVTRVTE